MTSTSLKSATGILTLLAIKGIGATTAQRIIANFETFDDVLGADDAAMKAVANQTIGARSSDTSLLPSLSRPIRTTQD